MSGILHGFLKHMLSVCDHCNLYINLNTNEPCIVIILCNTLYPLNIFVMSFIKFSEGLFVGASFDPSPSAICFILNVQKKKR